MFTPISNPSVERRAGNRLRCRRLTDVIHRAARDGSVRWEFRRSVRRGVRGGDSDGVG